jgi:hypothetical protein
MNINYYDKYIKYKQKYINYKQKYINNIQQNGGGLPEKIRKVMNDNISNFIFSQEYKIIKKYYLEKLDELIAKSKSKSKNKSKIRSDKKIIESEIAEILKFVNKYNINMII